jgi:hypothetical protein
MTDDSMDYYLNYDSVTFSSIKLTKIILKNYYNGSYHSESVSQKFGIFRSTLFEPRRWWTESRL